MKKRLLLLALVVLSSLLMGCIPPAPKATRTPRPSATPKAAPSPTPTQPPVTPSAGFAFGVEYMLPGGLAATYSQLGAKWARSGTTKQFSWGVIEPKAPAADGQHKYDWAEADRIVAEWQKAGFHIQVYTNANNTWASSTKLHHIPNPEFMDD